MKEQRSCNAAGYCRLSKDNDIHGKESASIKSQKSILRNYVLREHRIPR